jgi:dTDP-4-amino-4,6-dideoxygalactose transaminase
MRNIQMVDLQGQYTRLSVEIDQAMKQVLQDADFIQGGAVRRFESALAERYEVNTLLVVPMVQMHYNWHLWRWICLRARR